MIGRGVLVSVRDPREAEDALAGGAAVIDVKDPAAGSLGAAAPATIAAIASVVGTRVPWTMAAGELCDGVDPIVALVAEVRSRLAPSASEPAAVKAGLAGMAGRDWRGALAQLVDRLPRDSMHVAVAYADFDRVAAPPPLEVIETAAEFGCTTLLIDTADKRGPGLLAAQPAATLAVWVAAARCAGLGVALAGRLELAEITRAMEFGPDLVALRSAVCSNGGIDARLGSVDVELVVAAVAAAGTAFATPRGTAP